jgi:hypothetical protein
MHRRTPYSGPMKLSRPIALLIVGLACTAAAGAAPSVELTLKEGRVWLVARDATVGQIFSEWARVGNLQIVNAEKVPGLVTLELSGVPERQAVELLLRPAAGFVATRRGVPDAARSEFESIFIMAASRIQTRPVAPEPVFAPPTPAYPQIAPGVQRVIGADGLPVPDDQEDAPQPQPRQVSPGLPPGFSAPPQISPQPQPSAEPPATLPQGTVPVPGMIVPAPAPAPAPPDGRQR